MKVLLAEDDMINQKIIQIQVKKHGWELDVVANGFDAVEKAKSKEYDFILMDIQMPGMDGYGATKAIREYEKDASNHTCIFGLSAHSGETERQKALDCGMNGYLEKPFKQCCVDEILDIIESKKN